MCVDLDSMSFIFITFCPSLFVGHVMLDHTTNSDVPFRVAQLTTFEVTKSLYLGAKRSQSSDADSVSLSALEAAVCGAAAGSFSAAITNPLDRIKTLMMTDTTNAYGGSVMACASKIIKDEGLPGLFAGVVPRVGYIAPSVCIFFVTYEFVQQKMNTSD
mmetsp:Transcript_1231/g.2623  ORF Transcript_1231/g.2623 Transcript_1231/m.2623 type:complete len:159 (+) Transcript_1231:893-1369(+)